MARLVTKFGYLKENSGRSRGGYAKYIATREGVEKPDETIRDCPVTQAQRQLIQKLLSDFPDAKDLLEYEDYQKLSTLGSASEFISQALEVYAGEAAGRSGYLEYIGTRPRVEKQGSHGLFTSAGEPMFPGQGGKGVGRPSGEYLDRHLLPAPGGRPALGL